MLKKEFLDKVAENAGLYKYQAYMFWKAFEEVLIEELRQGEKIKIDCFESMVDSGKEQGLTYDLIYLRLLVKIRMIILKLTIRYF